MRKQRIRKLLAIVAAVCLLMTAACGCGSLDAADLSAALESVSFAPLPGEAVSALPEETPAAPEDPVPTAAVPDPEPPETPVPNETQAPPPSEEAPDAVAQTFRYEDVPPFSGQPYVAVNSNVPFFTPREITSGAFERYSNFDGLGRCGPAWASVGLELMPQDDREDISSVIPSGWNQAQVDGEWLYNRCHLIGWQLTGENARPQNLITGTRYLNIQGMLPFENMVADYVKETGGHVMYRATPVFVGDELVCRGVLLEGLSVEDEGDGITFCVFAYNVQPGVEINYADGSSNAEAPAVPAGTVPPAEQSTPDLEPAITQVPEPAPAQAAYIGNKNTGKFHVASCASVKKMKESNKVPMSSRDEAIAGGYVPCKNCNP
ncbi:MAG: DNA-entry nuclease [Clostridia bacterium]|nr:DNA-entry nuclease [Clostridia bacterium]